MLNRRPCAAARCCMLALVGLLVCLSATALRGPLPGDSTRQGDTISRFVVSFAEEHKQAVKQHLTQQGYEIISSGHGFYAVTHRSAVRKSPTAAAEAAPAVAAAAVVTQAAAHESLARTSSRGRRLIQQRKQREHTEHLLALQNVPGEHLPEPGPVTWASCARALVRHVPPSALLALQAKRS
jgi:hypothetical protein